MKVIRSFKNSLRNLRVSDEAIKERKRTVFAVFWVDAASYSGEKANTTPVGLCHQISYGVIEGKPQKSIGTNIEFVRIIQTDDGGSLQDWIDIPKSIISHIVKIGEVLV